MFGVENDHTHSHQPLSSRLGRCTYFCRFRVGVPLFCQLPFFIKSFSVTCARLNCGYFLPKATGHRVSHRSFQRGLINLESLASTAIVHHHMTPYCFQNSCPKSRSQVADFRGVSPPRVENVKTNTKQMYFPSKPGVYSRARSIVPPSARSALVFPCTLFYDFLTVWCVSRSPLVRNLLD